MPGTTDYGDAFEVFFLCRADHLTHPGFAELVTGRGMFGKFLPQCGYGFFHSLKYIGTVFTVLDGSFPP